DRSSNAIDVVNVHNNHITQLAVGAFKGVATSCASGNNNDCSGPDGVLIVENREVWAGDGDSTVKIVNIAQNQVTDTLHTNGKFPGDELRPAPRDELVMVHKNAADPPFSTFFSTDGNHAQLGKVQFTTSTNGAEQCVWSPRTGKFYIAIPETSRVTPREGAVAVIDPSNLNAIEKFFDIPLAG